MVPISLLTERNCTVKFFAGINALTGGLRRLKTPRRLMTMKKKREKWKKREKQRAMKEVA
jgi:hypothetical protein